MTAITATTVRSTPVTRAPLWFAVVAAVAVALALTVWLVARGSSSTTGTQAPANQAPVQHSQNQVCAPAPGTRFC